MMRKLFILFIIFSTLFACAAQGEDSFVPEYYGTPSANQCVCYDATQTRWEPMTAVSVLGTTVDDTEMTAENFGDWTCTGAEDGCTLNDGVVGDEDLNAEDYGEFTCTGAEDGCTIDSGAVQFDETTQPGSTGIATYVSGSPAILTTFAGLNNGVTPLLTDVSTLTLDNGDVLMVTGGKLDDVAVGSCSSAGQCLNHNGTGTFSCRTLDYTTDIAEGSVTGVAVFNSGAGGTRTSFDGLADNLSDVADNLTASDGDILLGTAGSEWDDTPLTTATNNLVSIKNLSDVNDSISFALGEGLYHNGTHLTEGELVNYDDDTDTAATSTTSATLTDITGLQTILSGGTQGNETIITFAQINVSISASTNCTFQMVQNCDGADTAITPVTTYNSDAQTAATTGLTDIVTLVGVFHPGAACGSASYTIEWAENSAGTCYQDESYMMTVAFLDE